MTTMILLAVLSAAAQEADVPALIQKLKSADTDDAENAQRDLIKAGGPALKPLREAAEKSEDAAFKKLAGATADRVEVRTGAAGLAKSWGDRWYSIYIQAVKTGWFHMKVEDKDGKLLLTDEIFVKESKTAEVSVKAVVLCEPDEYLTPCEIDLDVKMPDNTAAFKGKVREGRLVLRSDEKTKAVKLKPNTTVDFGVMRLVTILPRTEEYALAVIEMIKPNLRDGAILKFDKEESIEREGRKVKTRRFLLSAAETEDKFYWVDAEGRLLKMQLQSDQKDVEIILSDEKRAKDLDTDQ